METYSLDYFAETYLDENHTNEEKLQRCILSIYCYLKYVIRHFDNGYRNFGKSLYDYPLDLQIKAPKKYIKYMQFLKSEELYCFEFLIFSLGLIIRDKDPKNDDYEFEDTNFDTDHTYPSFNLLVAAHEKRTDITFEEAIDIILSDAEYLEMNMTEKEYFTITYQMLLGNMDKLISNS